MRRVGYLSWLHAGCICRSPNNSGCSSWVLAESCQEAAKSRPTTNPSKLTTISLRAVAMFYAYVLLSLGTKFKKLFGSWNNLP